MRIAITGATGGLGSFLAHSMVDRGYEVLTLGRGPDFSNRVRLAIEMWGPLSSAARIDAIEWDFSSSKLDHPGLPRSIDRFIHAAAETDLRPRSLPMILRTNTGMTLAALQLAHQLGVYRFDFVSTAYSCGRSGGWVPEEVHEIEPSFRNPYEQSKWTCEKLVMDSLAHGFQSVVIHRPSIVLPPLEKIRDVAPKALLQVFRRARMAASRLENAALNLEMDPKGRLSFVHLEDLAPDMLQVLDRDLSQRINVFHYSRSDGPRNGEWPTWVQRVLPSLQVNIGRNCGAGQRVLGELAPYLRDTFHFDQTRLASALGRFPTSTRSLGAEYFLPFMMLAMREVKV